VAAVVTINIAVFLLNKYKKGWIDPDDVSGLQKVNQSASQSRN
jgi:hypothetical protein